MRRPFFRAVLLASVAVLGVPGAPAVPAHAAPAGNDNFDDATTVSALPFTDTFTVADTSAEYDARSECEPLQHDAWYRFVSPADGRYVAEATLSGSSATNQLNVAVATGSSRHTLLALDCGSDSVGNAFGVRRASFRARAGDVLFVTAGMFDSPDGTIEVSMRPITSAPANDDLKDATTITALPFTQTLSTAGATRERGEYQWGTPTMYVAGSLWFTNYQGCNALTESVWYRYNPERDTVADVSTNSEEGTSTFSVFVETPHGPKSLGTCSAGPFVMNGGDHYLIQVGRIPEGTPPNPITFQITGIAPTV